MLVSPINVAILSCSGQDLFPPACLEPVELIFFHQPDQFFAAEADIYIDCEFECEEERIQQLTSLFPSIVMVNAVNFTTEMIKSPFTRFNGWPGFTHQPVLELAQKRERIPKKLQQFAQFCGKACVQVPDSVGMVRPRIISMIINEAWLTLGEGVSTSQEIDTAMKLGTNYPFGPFEWGEKIGLSRIVSLLDQLAKTDSKYCPAPNLVAAAQLK